MKRTIPLYSLLFSVTFLFTACGGSDVREGEIDPAEVVSESPDYEDIDSDQDGEISYEEQSARGPSTVNTTNYTERGDSLMRAGDTLVTPRYTDDEYEPAFSTSTTNPANQVEGGVTPGNNQKKQ
jgi:hypothetical protein